MEVFEGDLSSCPHTWTQTPPFDLVAAHFESHSSCPMWAQALLEQGVRLFGSGSCADSALHKDTRPGGHTWGPRFPLGLRLPSLWSWRRSCVSQEQGPLRGSIVSNFST